MSARIERITFPGSQGDELAARLDLPAGPPIAFALFAHCFTCGKDVKAASRIATALTDSGFGVLRFDFTGLGNSDGEFANTNFTSNTDDVLAAAEWLRHRAPSPTAPDRTLARRRRGLGHRRRHRGGPRCCDDWRTGGPGSTSTGVFADAVDEIAPRQGEADVQLAGRTFTIRQQFLDDLRNHVVTDRVAESREGALSSCTHRSTTPLASGMPAEIFDAARHPKSFVSLDGADHLLTDPVDAAFAASMIAGFAKRYVADQSGALGGASSQRLRWSSPKRRKARSSTTSSSGNTGSSRTSRPQSAASTQAQRPTTSWAPRSVRARR